MLLLPCPASAFNEQGLVQTEPDLVDMVQTGDSEVFRSCKKRPCYLRRVGTLSAATSLPLFLQAVWWGHALFFRPGGERRRAPRRTTSLWEESSLDSASTPRRDEETPHHFINCRPVLSIADVAGHGIMVRAWEREDHCSTSANEGELSRHSRRKTPPEPLPRNDPRDATSRLPTDGAASATSSRGGRTRQVAVVNGRGAAERVDTAAWTR